MQFTRLSASNYSDVKYKISLKFKQNAKFNVIFRMLKNNDGRIWTPTFKIPPEQLLSDTAICWRRADITLDFKTMTPNIQQVAASAKKVGSGGIS